MAESRSAGRSAKEDLLVTIARGASGLQIELQSTVGRLYGERIVAVARDAAA
ncbi:MAG: citrate lyase ACP, partial [Deltaproteobacteria bacterium]|nr:citrate lyase ACP [Deltaproteobacteria bacterium]